jgi:hypothetical protein
MLIYIDPTKDAEDNVWVLINAANGTAFGKSGPISLGAATPAAGPDGHNTEMVLTGDGVALRGTVSVYYTRLGFLDNIAPPYTSYDILDNDITKEALLAILVDILKLVASDVTIVEETITYASVVTLRPIPGSLLYVGDSAFNLNWPNAPLDINTLVTIDDLPGFNKKARTQVNTVVITTSMPGFDKVQGG